MIKNDLVKHEQCSDIYYTATHKSGLKVALYPKEGYNSTYAIFGTNYGSADITFKRSDESDYFTVPAGVAHFLEHKLFENEDSPVFAQYAKTGASGNAYTSFDKTCYLFSATDNINESLRILLNFVQKPYFTDENVQKEQGIIAQEIKMYEDNANWCVLFNLLECLYHNNPTKVNIAGTVESISQITKDTLYRCYNTFYSLPNMIFCLVGKFNINEVCDLIDELIIPKEEFTVERVVPKEPDEIVCKEKIVKMSVEIPLFEMGYKQNVTTNYRTVKETVDTAILLEILTSKSSKLYNRLLESKLINDSFGCEYFSPLNTSAVIFAGESQKPFEVCNIIKEEIALLKQNGIDDEDFNRAKKIVYGYKVSALGKVDSIANQMSEMMLYNQDFSSELEEIVATTKEDIYNRLVLLLDEKYSAISIVEKN